MNRDSEPLKLEDREAIIIIGYYGIDWRRQSLACVARGTGKLSISHSSQLQRALQPIRLLNVILAL